MTCFHCQGPMSVDEVDADGNPTCDDCYCSGCDRGHGGLRCSTSAGSGDAEEIDDPDRAHDARIDALLGV